MSLRDGVSRAGGRVAASAAGLISLGVVAKLALGVAIGFSGGYHGAQAGRALATPRAPISQRATGAVVAPAPLVERCTVLVIGATATMTIEGPNAGALCAEGVRRHPTTSEHGAVEPSTDPLVCSYRVEGVDFRVRDRERPPEIGKAICQGMRSEGAA